jgi:hypothetical protein
MQWFYFSEIAYFIDIGVIKLAFLFFFLQIFPNKRFRMAVWVFVTLNIASIISFAFAAIFVCSPVSYAWTAWDGLHKGKCVNNNSLAFVHAGFGIISDFITLSLPISQIMGLQLGTKKKIGVLLMFSVGALYVTFTQARLPYPAC